MTIYLLDKTLQIEIFYENEDQDLDDNICVKIIERCPPSEKIMRMGETHLFLTVEQARQLGETLLKAARHSEWDDSQEGETPDANVS